MTDDIASLRADLSGIDVCRKLAAARALSEMGDEAQAAAVELVRAVADEHENVREWCTSALEELGPPDESTLPALMELLTNEYSDVAIWAATLLGRLEIQAEAAVSDLSAALAADRPLTVRQKSAWALGKIGSAAALPSLRQASEDSDARLARLAAESIEQIGE